MNERFKTDLQLYKKNIHDENQTSIKDLNDELSQLKEKMKFVYDKDKEIKELKYQLIEIRKVVELYSKYKTQLQTVIKKVRNQEKYIKDLENNNKELKEIIQKYKVNSKEEDNKSEKLKGIILDCILEREKGRLEIQINNIDDIDDNEIDEDNIGDVIRKLI
jgi:CRISPR/Cas system-associated endonuclease Cas3-HD